MTALAYHDVVAVSEADNSGFPGPLAARYKLSPDRFREHLDAISTSGVRVFSGGEFQPAGRDTVLLTFDDGGASSLDIAAELERRGWRGCFFIVSSLLGEPGFLSASEVSQLAKRGHLIGSHSHSHPTYMARLSHEELASEWRLSRDRLHDCLGFAPTSASVPGGYYSDQVAHAAAESGYRLLFTSDPGDRVRLVGGIEVLGRWAVWSTTPAATAAAYTRPRSMARARLRLEWRAKHAAKSLNPRLYDVLRGVRARRGSHA